VNRGIEGLLRPTVNDIARAAGVSLATVDRVLNDRPGVRPAKMQAVQEAILRLGYVRDMAAANLARGRTYRMAFVLPDSDGQFVRTLTEAIGHAERQMANARTAIMLRCFPGDDPHQIAAVLQGLPEEDVTGVALMAPETPVVRDALRALRARGVPVVALASDLPNTERERFVGIDNVAAGRTAGVLMGRFLGGGPGEVLVIGESMLLRESLERRLGFDRVLQESFPQLVALPTLETHGRAEELREVLRRSLSHVRDLRGLYLLGAGHRALSEALDGLEIGGAAVSGGLTVIGHELTPQARAALQTGTMHAVIMQNPGHLVRSALRVLRAIADRAPIDEAQEQIRIEIVMQENLPPA
jgi:LacI family transcriptional regulator